MSSMSYAPINAPITPFVDKSIAAATGASQVLAAANVDRRELVLFNISNKDWWINAIGTTAAADTPPSFLLAKGGTAVLTSTNAVTGIGTLGKALVALER